MDPNNQNDQENQNLSQQYQDILDRYAKDLDQKNSSEITPESVEETLSDNLYQPPEDIHQDHSETVENIPKDPLESIENIPKDPLESTENISLSQNTSDPPLLEEPVSPPTSNLFKYIFYLSLIIFIGVAITILYNLYFKKSLPDNDISNKITPTSTINTVPTITPSETTLVCNLNDQSYKVGDSFKAADGCNNCTCTEDLTISCTEIACETPPSTKSASISTVAKEASKSESIPTVKSDPLVEAKKYLDAYVKGDWTTVKSLCSDKNFDETIATGYSLTEYKIISSKYDTDKKYYHVNVNFTDSNGKIYKTVPPSKPLEILMYNDNGNWKALTWYFFN